MRLEERFDLGRLAEELVERRDAHRFVREPMDEGVEPLLRDLLQTARLAVRLQHAAEDVAELVAEVAARPVGRTLDCLRGVLAERLLDAERVRLRRERRM